jgi:hypothetical protein
MLKKLVVICGAIAIVGTYVAPPTTALAQKKKQTSQTESREAKRSKCRTEAQNPSLRGRGAGQAAFAACMGR